MAMDKLVDSAQLDGMFTEIANAIRAKTGGTGSYTPQQMPDAIAAIQTGGGSAPSIAQKDVNFYDYDGTLLHSYTLTEAAALTELPPLPTQPGLICQEWNWNISDIKAMGRSVDVGATYITDDGKTRLYISITEPRRMDVPLVFAQSIPHGVTVNWGDGSDDEIFDGIQIETSHMYTNIGDYVITMDVADDCELTLGEMLGGDFYGHTLFSVDFSTAYSRMLTKVEMGSKTKLSELTFFGCTNLRSITVPLHTASIFDYTFSSCKMLSCVILPNELENIGNGAFSNCNELRVISIPNSIDYIEECSFECCYNLTHIVIPDSVTSIGFALFADCYRLTDFVIPSGINTISISILAGCDGLQKIIIPESVEVITDSTFTFLCGLLEVHLYPNNPPEIQEFPFDELPFDCVIYVPEGCLESYQTATNWDVYADLMREEGT